MPVFPFYEPTPGERSIRERRARCQHCDSSYDLYEAPTGVILCGYCGRAQDGRPAGTGITPFEPVDRTIELLGA